MNWKDNIPPFYMGQKVVALIDMRSPMWRCRIKKGDVVPVRGTMFCCEWRVDVGVASPIGVQYSCGTCERDFSMERVVWFPSRNFRPLESQPFPLIKLSEIKEKEKEEILIEN